MSSEKSLSVIVPARNEEFLSLTVDDLLKNIRGDTDIICVLDGNWPNPPIKDNPRVTLIYHSESIGQRAACNEAAKWSRAKYLMKVDAHCAFDEGFDVKMMEKMQDDVCMVPVMRNLHVFDWVCPNGHRRYQGPSGPCSECGQPTQREIKWIAKTNPQSTAFAFGPEPKFMYMDSMKKRPEYKDAVKQTGLTETMSIQGSCFMMPREKYLELKVDDESLGSWGSQGICVACKTWLSGGRVLTNHDTFYAHCFRTQGGDFGFPWPCSGRQADRAKKMARELFFNGKFDGQVRPLSWLVEKFWPIDNWKEVKGWTEKDLMELKESEKKFWGTTPLVVKPTPTVAKKTTVGLTKGVVYYSDSQLDPEILIPCQHQLLRCLNGIRLVSVTLKPMDFGENYVLPLERGVLSMFRQILEGIKRCETDIIFLAEHDVLYTKEHFLFTPPRKDTYYYNENQWQLDTRTGKALFYHCMRLSAMVGYRELLLEHYTKRVARFEKEPFTLKTGYEPGKPLPWGIDNNPRERFMTPYPLIDLRHTGTVSPNRWRQKDFRNKEPLWAWTEANAIPGWTRTHGRMKQFLEGLK